MGVPPPVEGEDLHPNVAILPEITVTTKKPNPIVSLLILGTIAYFVFGKGGNGRYNW